MQSTDAEWRNVFLIGAGMLIGPTFIFIIFGSGKVQKWNEIVEEVDETKMDTFVLNNIDKSFEDEMIGTKK